MLDAKEWMAVMTYHDNPLSTSHIIMFTIIVSPIYDKPNKKKHIIMNDFFKILKTFFFFFFFLRGTVFKILTDQRRRKFYNLNNQMMMKVGKEEFGANLI